MRPKPLAAGHNTGEDLVNVIDDDVPTLTLLLESSTIVESGGPSATTATITRDIVSGLALTVSLTGDDTSEATIQPSATIPAGVIVTAGSGANAISRDIDFGREFVLRRADRLLFGTDYLAPGQQVPQFSLYKELDLPTDVQEKVFRGNARKLLRV